MAKADLSWTRPTRRTDGTRVTAIAFYDLERKPSGGSYEALPSFSQAEAPVNTWEDNNIPDLWADETYTYRLRAGEGGYADSDWVETDLDVPGDTSLVARLANTFHINAQGSIGSSETAELEADATGTWDTISYAWSITKGGGTIKGDGDKVVYTPASNLTGTDNVTVKCVATARGTGYQARNGTSATQEDTEDFQVTATATVTYSPDPPVAGKDVTASFSTFSGIDRTSYQWQFRRASTSAAQNRSGATSLTWTLPDDFAGRDIRLRWSPLNNENRFFYSSWATVVEATVTPPPPVLTDAVAPSVSISGLSDVLSGSRITLTANVTGGTYDTLAYSWSTNLGRVGSGDASETFVAPTVSSRDRATVSLTVTAAGTGTNAKDGTSATASDTHRITIEPPGTEQFAAVTYSPATAKQGDTVTATVPGSGSGYRWQRSTDGGTSWADFSSVVPGSRTKSVRLSNFIDVKRIVRVSWVAGGLKFFASNHVTVQEYTPRDLRSSDVPEDLTLTGVEETDESIGFYYTVSLETTLDRGRQLGNVQVVGRRQDSRFDGTSDTETIRLSDGGSDSFADTQTKTNHLDLYVVTKDLDRALTGWRARLVSGSDSSNWSAWADIDEGILEEPDDPVVRVSGPRRGGGDIVVTVNERTQTATILEYTYTFRQGSVTLVHRITIEEPTYTWAAPVINRLGYQVEVEAINFWGSKTTRVVL